jgi:hypothetical protein
VTFSPSTNQVSNQASLIAYPYDGKLLIVNKDPNNEVYIGGDQGVSATNPNTYGTIDPLGSITFDNNEQIFAICADGQTATVEVLPDAESFSVSPAAIAAQIFASGVSLVDNPVTLANYTAGSPFTVPVSGSGTVSLFSTNPTPTNKYQSWGLFVQNRGSTPAIPYLRMQMQWFNDSQSTIPMHTEDWILNTNASYFTWFSGHGRMHGPYFNINFTNYDGTTPVPLAITLFGSNRIETEDSIRSNTTAAPVNGLGTDDVLFWGASNTLAANASVGPIAAHLFNGPCTIRFRVTGASATNVVQLGINFEPISDFNNDNSVILEGPTATGSVSDQVLDIYLPKRHSSFTVTNSGTTTVSYRVMVIAKGATI